MFKEIKYFFSKDAQLYAELYFRGYEIPWGAFAISLIKHPTSTDFGYKTVDSKGQTIINQVLLETEEEWEPFKGLDIPIVKMNA